MDIRLVAYRRKTSGSAPYDVDEFELDLQQAPNVVVNYNWLDLKNPDNRKSSFSQTIKIPFSNRNNKFFENYFDVNLEGAVYNAQTKFRAMLFVDSIEQLNGFIQLKAIYLNSRLYEVVLFGNTADFFTDIKNKRLKDAFKTVNETTGVITDDKQLDHKLTVDNVINSWTTGVTTIEDTPTTTNDIMYPIIDYGFSDQPLSSAMFWDPETLLDEIIGIDQFSYSSEAILNAMNSYGAIRPSMLKPAIRIQKLFHIIAQKAGYQIKSSFLGIDDTNASTPITDTQFFSRLFMTLANQFERTQTVFETATSTAGAFVGFEMTNSGTLNSSAIPFFPGDSMGDNAYQWLFCSAKTYDPNNMGFLDMSTLPYTVDPGTVPYAPAIQFPGFDVAGNDATLPTGTVQIETTFTIVIPATTTSGAVNITNTKLCCFWNRYAYEYINVSYEDQWLTPGTHQVSFISEIDGLPNEAFYLMLKFNESSGDGSLVGQTWTPVISDLTIKTLSTGEVGMFGGMENGDVNMYNNMPDISQADFVKDLVNRFNLIIKTDEDNERLLLIEPYQDYIGDGAINYWTDKVDVSKEQVIKSTNELQSKSLSFKDLEDNDILNQRYTAQQGVVYGERRREIDNDFAQGNFSNFSIFSPFIAQGIPEWTNYAGINGSTMPGQDVAIAYNFGAEVGEESKVLNDLKPKLFYYSGTPIEFSYNSAVFGDAKFAIYSNSFVSSLITAFVAYSNPSNPTVNKFPLCTQYNLDNLNTGITANTKVLNWSYYSPSFNTGFTFNYFGSTTTLKGYYNDYWAQYINEIYDKDARIMECYVNLSPQDIRSFAGKGFQNTYFIKNCLWRVISIDNYLVGGNKSTKVTFLKVIERLQSSCDAIPLVTDSGLLSWTDAETGASTTITNECCTEQNPDWVFVQTNSTTGVGDCYSTYTNVVNGDTGTGTTTNPNVGFTQQPMLTGENSVNGTFIPALMPNIQNNFPIKALSRSTMLTRSITFYAQATTGDNSTVEVFTNNGYTNKILSLPSFSMANVVITLLGTVLNGTNTGKIGRFDYTTVLVSRGNLPTYIGAAGGTLKDSERDSAFSIPTVNITTFDSNGFWKPTITGGANEQVTWTAKIELLTQPVGNPNSEIPAKALFQNGDRILFENLNLLEWN